MLKEIYDIIGIHSKYSKEELEARIAFEIDNLLHHLEIDNIEDKYKIIVSIVLSNCVTSLKDHSPGKDIVQICNLVLEVIKFLNIPKHNLPESKSDTSVSIPLSTKNKITIEEVPEYMKIINAHYREVYKDSIETEILKPITKKKTQYENETPISSFSFEMYDEKNKNIISSSQTNHVSSFDMMIELYDYYNGGVMPEQKVLHALIERLLKSSDDTFFFSEVVNVSLSKNINVTLTSLMLNIITSLRADSHTETRKIIDKMISSQMIDGVKYDHLNIFFDRDIDAIAASSDTIQDRIQM